MIQCFYRPEGAFTLRLEQYETHQRRPFKVTYGLEVYDRLTYTEAAHKLGEALMHCLACEGKVDSTRG